MILSEHPYGRPYFHEPTQRVIFLMNKYNDGSYLAQFQFKNSLNIWPRELREPTHEEILRDYPEPQEPERSGLGNQLDQPSRNFERMKSDLEALLLSWMEKGIINRRDLIYNSLFIHLDSAIQRLDDMATSHEDYLNEKT